MIKNYLIAPGPTPVPPRVALAMAQPMIHHRTPQFSAIFADAKRLLKELYRTEQDVLMLASSGTGAMESAVTNLYSPGDKVLTVNGGKFGERWGKIAGRYGLTNVQLDVAWGDAVDPAAIAAILDAQPDIRGVFLQASETSTAALHPVQEVARITRARDVLLTVDGITAVGVLDLPMDAWGIDVLLTGSQKALMLPPGLAIIGLSARAWERTQTAKLPRFYFDLVKERDSHAKDTSTWTPAISLIIGLREALRMMQEEGWANVFARQDRLARATRAAAAALGLPLVAPKAPAPGLTAIYTPESVPGGKLVAYLRDAMGVTFAGGQDHLKGKVVRVAHMGYMGAFDTITAIAAFEMALKKFGYAFELGRGVAAAQEVLMEGMPE